MPSKPSLAGAGPLGGSVFPLVHAIFRVDGSWLPRFTLTRETAKSGPDLLTHRNGKNKYCKHPRFVWLLFYYPVMGNQHKKMGTPSVGVQFKRVAGMKSFEKNNWVRRGGQDPGVCML